MPYWKTCKIEDCDRDHYGRGWCEMHWKRWKRHGDPNINLRPDRVHGTPEQRFWTRVDKSGECWQWTGNIGPYGGGVFRLSRDATVAPHRLVYRIHVGPIPDGMLVAQRCGNKVCVRPEHLKLITRKDIGRKD
jgi:hypothetical protein